MISRFQDAHPRPANHHSALFQTGGSSPLSARLASGLSAHTGTPRIAAHTGRPGPQPTSARIATAVAARNAATQGTMRQAIQGAKRILGTPTQSYLEWQPGTNGRRGWTKMGKDEWGQNMFAARVQEVWVYAQQTDVYGSLRFFVANPKNNTRVYFEPVGYISAEKQFHGTTTATGEFGRVYRNTLGVVVGGFATGGLALEFEAGTAFLAATRETLIRFGGQLAEEFTVKKFFTKVFVDASVQFGSGLITKGSVNESINDMNLVSMVVAGIMPGERWIHALRNSSINSTFKAGTKFDETGMHPYMELPDFSTMEGISKYLLNVGFGTLGDKAKGAASEAAAPAYRLSLRVMQNSENTILRWFAAQRVVLGTLGTVTTAVGVDATNDKVKEKLGERLPGAKKENHKK